VRQLREEAQIVLDINSNFSLQRDSSLFTIGVGYLAHKSGQLKVLSVNISNIYTIIPSPPQNYTALNSY